MYQYTRGSNQSSFRSEYPLTDDEIFQHAPSVLADTPHDSRGPRYTFIPTRDVLRGLRKEGFQPFEVRQTKCRDIEKREYTKHLVRLRHPMALRGYTHTEEVPEIILLNSHDGTSSYQLLSGLFRFVCSNGLIDGSIHNDFKIRHSGNVIDNVIEGSFRVIENLKELSERVERYSTTRLLPDESRAFAESARALRWGETAPVSARALLNARRFDDFGDTAWRVFNRVQENLLAGGVPGRAATGRRTTTRAVQSVHETVRLNRGLWSALDDVIEHKLAV